MAALPPTPSPDAHQSSAVLLQSLSDVLPKGYKFHAYHLSTPPTRTDALYSAPDDVRPDRTYCENHFLTLTIDVPPSQLPDAAPRGAEDDDAGAAQEVLVLALEILIFTTAYSSTFFVSKADSTGFLHLLNLPKGTPSPIREVTAAFISYLVGQRKRKGIQSIVSLFARAQGQYLFPGSVEYKGKHVLTDRGLVRWWCKVLNPLLVSPPGKGIRNQPPWQSVKGYLIVPGLDTYETRAFIPRTAANIPNPDWIQGHPLERISHYTYEYEWVPPRCLIPRYPDDPKSRFRDELDAEADHGKGRNGAWTSVHNMQQFWEVMEFRQECSMGGLTGFIWIVMDPLEPNERLSSQTSFATTPNASFDSSLPSTTPNTPSRNHTQVLPVRTPQASPMKSLRTPRTSQSTSSNLATVKKKKKKKLTGPIVSREPRAKTGQRNYLVDRPITTAYYYWPPEGRGRRLVKEDGYKRSIELLLRLDFANLELAVGSTARWINEVGLGSAWGLDITGTRAPPPTPSTTTTESGVGQPATISNLSGLIKRKRPAENSGASDVKGPAADEDHAPRVNVLSAGLVRKKVKDSDGAAPNGTSNAGTGGLQTNTVPALEPPGVYRLNGSLVRKKRTADDTANSASETEPNVPLEVPHVIVAEPSNVNVLGAGLVRKKPKPA